MDTIASTELPAAISLPSYDRSALRSRIVHLGFGAFHRAHQALFTHRVLALSGEDWGICEINLVGGEALISALREQDHLYTVLEKGADASSAHIVGSVHESLHPTYDGIESVLNKLAEPQVSIVSLTVTEKGYCMLPGGSHLDLNNPMIIADLASPGCPASAPGVIVEALRRRRERGVGAFTVLSCDNIPENGHVVRHAVLELAQAQDAELARWIASSVTFPNTMVDRIVPAATPDTLKEIAQVLGVNDPCGIACEPFIQWVVEDKFVAGRPAWEKVGVELVREVLPYEEMKLRMLNGSHSFLAYLGYLAGYQSIDAAMGSETYRRAIRALMMQEQAPTLSITGVDLAAYGEKLAERFSNPSLRHRTWQIAMDGSQKLPQRMLDPIRWHLRHGGSFDFLSLGVAGWMRYVGGTDDNNQPIDIRDPLLDDIRAACEAGAAGVERVNALLSLRNIFGADLAGEAKFVENVTRAYLLLERQGAEKTVAQWVQRGTL
ncbi:fructuronate reductase [Acerihabitans sp. KWT182]|uniref:Fructuronate reductase n=1 Tax=Acerihabitans sp. KWT182 TaxID=3157919 RepID=A0AAU7Q4P5_9GAMM